MLSDNFRFTIENRTGVTIDASKIVIKYRGKYFDPATGKLTFEPESFDVAAQSSSIADDAFNEGTTIDNGFRTNPIIEAEVYIQFNLSTNTATPNGFINILLQRATSDTPVFGSNNYARDQTVIVAALITAKEDVSIVANVS
jgi:hypothetical protein